MKNRIRFTTAGQVVAAFPAAAEELGVVPVDASPLSHIEQYLDVEDPLPGLVFAGLALPKREAVWWACLVLRGIGPSDASVAEGLRLAEAWVRNPEEAERRAAGEYAESQFFEGAGAWVAFAAFTTSGSLAPAGLQTVPPSPEISGKCAAFAVMTAADDEDPDLRLGKLRAALASAIDFASGGDGTGPWKKHGRGN